MHTVTYIYIVYINRLQVFFFSISDIAIWFWFTSHWLSPRNFLFLYICTLYVSINKIIWFSVEKEYCGLINIHWIPVFLDFVLSWSTKLNVYCSAISNNIIVLIGSMNFILKTVKNSWKLMPKNFKETTVDQNCWYCNFYKNTWK